MSFPTVAMRCQHSLSDLGTKHKGHSDIDGIDDFQPRNLPSVGDKVNLVDVYYDKKGIRRVKGNGQLKSSQAYPKQFFGRVRLVSDCICNFFWCKPVSLTPGTGWCNPMSSRGSLEVKASRIVYQSL